MRLQVIASTFALLNAKSIMRPFFRRQQAALDTISLNDGSQVNAPDLNNNPVGNLNGDAFCAAQGVPKCNGEQLKDGTQCCSVTVIGVIPGNNEMVSSIIAAPANGATVARNDDINFQVNTLNMDVGFFSNATNLYYVQGQTLNAQGIIQGHQHITVQKIGADGAVLDASKFDFFKGLNDLAPSQNGVSALGVAAAANTFKEDGEYRVCTITGSLTHQPIVMPVAQRGSQDDCIRINIVADQAAVGAATGGANIVDNLDPAAVTGAPRDTAATATRATKNEERRRKFAKIFGISQRQRKRRSF